MLLLVIGLSLGIVYLLHVAIAALSRRDSDESPGEPPPLVPLRRIR